MSHQMVLLLQLLSLASLADPPCLYSNCNIQNKFLPYSIYYTLHIPMQIYYQVN